MKAVAEQLQGELASKDLYVVWVSPSTWARDADAWQAIGSKARSLHAVATTDTYYNPNGSVLNTIRQHLAAQRDLAGDGYVAPYLDLRQGARERRGDSPEC